MTVVNLGLKGLRVANTKIIIRKYCYIVTSCTVWSNKTTDMHYLRLDNLGLFVSQNGRGP